MGLGGILKKAFTSVKLKKREFDPEMVDIQDIELPLVIIDLDNELIKTMLKEELATYKSLGYKDKPIGALDVLTYHSFQIGILLRFLQLDYELFIPDRTKFFPSYILDIDKDALIYKVFEIIDRYDKHVPKAKNVAVNLTTQLRWSPLEAGYVLYYLSVYQSDPIFLHTEDNKDKGQFIYT